MQPSPQYFENYCYKHEIKKFSPKKVSKIWSEKFFFPSPTKSVRNLRPCTQVVNFWIRQCFRCSLLALETLDIQDSQQDRTRAAGNSHSGIPGGPVGSGLELSRCILLHVIRGD